MDLTSLQRLQRISGPALQRAEEKGALQFLTWANTGSGGSKSPAKPPIRFGILRGSSSTFVNGKLVGVYPQNIRSGTIEKPTPAKSTNKKNIVWVWNTGYATKMHEGEYELGEFSAKDGNAGPKWIEKHLQADKEALIDFIGEEFFKETGIR